MALQFIVQTKSSSELSTSLGKLAESIELFPVSSALWGISIPTKIVDVVGEDRIRNNLAKFNFYNLYAGEWRYA